MAKRATRNDTVMTRQYYSYRHGSNGSSSRIVANRRLADIDLTDERGYQRQ